MLLVSSEWTNGKTKIDSETFHNLQNCELAEVALMRPNNYFKSLPRFKVDFTSETCSIW